MRNFKSKQDKENKKTKGCTTYSRNVYSILAYINSIHGVEQLIEEYKKGTKLFLLTSGAAVYDEVMQYYQEYIREWNLIYSSGQFKIESLGRPFTIDDTCKSEYTNTYHGFNILVTYPGSWAAAPGAAAPFLITDGTPGEVDKFRKTLLWFNENSGFNFSQYQIEHAHKDKHILVVAGAGTGKTHCMMSRLTYLQYINKYLPEEFAEKAAMITFTNEAADTMKTRLKTCFQNYYMLTRDYSWFSLTEQVDNMVISTIHSFSKDLIQKHASNLGYGKEITIVSGDYERKEYIEEVLEDYYRKKAAEFPDFAEEIGIPTHYLKNILLEILNKLYSKNVSILDQDLDFGTPHNSKKGKLMHQLITEVLREAEQKYQLQLAEENKIHLSDLINKLRYLLQASNVNFSHAMIRHLFIDEFQDTDNVQIELIKQLQSRIGFKYFVVGDVKQCIYRFRGAEEVAFAELIEKPLPADWQWFAMNKNYRSDRKLLNLFERHFQEWGKSRKLFYHPVRDYLAGQKGMNEHRKTEDYFRFIRLSSPSKKKIGRALVHEINTRSKEIQAFIETGHTLREEERTIAVLVRTNKEAQEVYDYGKNAVKYGGSGSIFIQVDTGGDLYFSEPVIDLYKLVLALKYPMNSKYLFNLTSTCYFPARVCLGSLYGEGNHDQLRYLLERLNHYLETCSAALFHNSEKSADWLDWVNKLKYEPVLRVLKSLIDVLRPWDQFAASYNYSREEAYKARTYYKRNLELVFEKLAVARETDYITVNSLENYLKIKITTGQNEKTREAAASASDSGVRIICITVHKAKGLEFDTVIMPYGYRIIDKINHNSQAEVITDGKKVGYRVYYEEKEASKNPIILNNSYYNPSREGVERFREETRILYVAMTRAIRNFTFFIYENVQRPNSWQGLLKQGRYGHEQL